MKKSWYGYFMGMAEQAASKSKDPVSKVGCVVVGFHENVLSTGYNGLPRKVQDLPERYEDRDRKLKLIIHAEANAVAAAARAGVNLYGSTAFVTKPPCPQCAALLIQAGVLRVVTPPIDLESRWAADCVLATELFREANVCLESFE